eukprot:CAMPEP_0118635164 /NCGR_PEP_ID=MMETSP0785-20121206/1931_1 /TAXON_ID=91992 /ORGANISM="Bolidomonas pacifica, Strain CCMP 1866" /LENGTH=138 /DNA_ID=CAMNT_0006526181 /DNA_START=689 /DNA_END=1104 /DNA_ORIENTATION=+
MIKALRQVRGMLFTSSEKMKIPQTKDTRTINVLHVPCATARPAFWTAYIAATPPGTQNNPDTIPQGGYGGGDVFPSVSVLVVLWYNKDQPRCQQAAAALVRLEGKGVNAPIVVDGGAGWGLYGYSKGAEAKSGDEGGP